MASSGKPLGEPQLAVPPGPNIILLSGMREVTNDQVGSFFSSFFLAPQGCTSGEKRSRPMASSGKPLGHSSTDLRPGSKNITPERGGVNVHLGEHFSAGLHDHFFFGTTRMHFRGKTVSAKCNLFYAIAIALFRQLSNLPVSKSI